jgi:hypothetical protein
MASNLVIASKQFLRTMVWKAFKNIGKMKVLSLTLGQRVVK